VNRNKQQQKPGLKTPKKMPSGISRKRRISLQKFSGLFHAVLDHPGFIKEVALLHPGVEKRVFGEMLESRPAIDIARLYQVAVAIGRAEYLHRLVNHAILMRKTDDLWCAVLRLARKWAKNDISPVWDLELTAAREIMRLMLHVSLEFYEEMLDELKPSKRLWFLAGVDFGQLWRRNIQLEVEAGHWDHAFDSLVMAACGLPVSAKLMERWAKNRHFDAIAEAKDAFLDDEFGWRVYGRTPDFAGLVNYLWTLHVDAGMVTALSARNRTPHAQKLRFRVRTSRGYIMSDFRSMIGILARDAKGVEYELVKHRGEQRRRPVFIIGQTLLNPCMARFQQLVVYYQHRHASGLRPIVNVSPKGNAALLS